MKKIILIPDSFKGSMSSLQICSIMERAIKRYYFESEIISVPVADGGEGSVDAFIGAVGGKKVYTTVTGPYFKPVEAFYGILTNNVAIIEMASCAGLPLVKGDLQPDKTTTFGVGELILHAVKQGCKKIILGLGGSATNDGGVGAAAACGISFYNSKNVSFVPVGGTLSQIAKIDMSSVNPILEGVEIVTMCDIDNPMYGKEGAAHIFAPQKGADLKMVEFLDNQLKHLANQIETDLGKEVSTIAGSGAAGGMGAGMVAFFDSPLQSGIDIMLDTVDFDNLVKDANYIFTGEGKLDSQSLRGKVVIGVARRIKEHNIPLIAVVGDIGNSIEGVYEEGVSAVFSINRTAVPLKEAIKRADDDLYLTMVNLMQFLKNIESR